MTFPANGRHLTSIDRPITRARYLAERRLMMQAGGKTTFYGFRHGAKDLQH